MGANISFLRILNRNENIDSNIISKLGTDEWEDSWYSWGVDEKNKQIVVDRAMAFECR